ncbi:MAG: hypothetical protein J6J61_08110 [Muribaculaceae bacterium]|nr:hypothetical protein [Clostridia bacterium]MBP3590525.1 hypothetical protein [Muribaculaceae bacterium]
MKLQKKSPSLTEGIYLSTITSVIEDTPEEGKFTIHYKLTDENGKNYQKREIFLNSTDSRRYVALIDYLEHSLGHPVEDTAQLVGIKEKLTLAYGKETRGVQYLNITHREFIGIEPAAESEGA